MPTGERPCAEPEAGEPQDLLRLGIALLVDLGGMDFGVLRVANGDGLRSRASVGLDDEVHAGFTSPLEFEALESLPQLHPLSLDDPRVSDALRGAGARSIYWLTLPHRAVRLAACLGSRDTGELCAEPAARLLALATVVAGAIGNQHALQLSMQTLRARDERLADLAHDLKNSVNAIALSTTILEQGLPPSSPLRGVLERMTRNTQRASNVIQSILSTGALEAGKLTLRHDLIDPAELVLAAAEAQQDASVAKGVVLATDLSPGLPPVRADRERMLEVFDNLVSNALKFTAAGGTVSVGAALRDGVVFWVKDTGSGIPSDELHWIFERYWRATPSDRRGTGLGLSICKGIVEAHGGAIWAESSVGQGTTVLFSLPAQPELAGSEAAPAATVLIVDDRHENRAALAAILESEGHRIITAASGAEALRIALKEELSVVLLDVEMPEMSGFEVASYLKLAERTKAVPILLVTAHGHDPERVYRAYSAGGADYLVKPLDPDVVRRKVAVFAELGQRRARRDSEHPSRS